MPERSNTPPSGYPVLPLEGDDTGSRARLTREDLDAFTEAQRHVANEAEQRRWSLLLAEWFGADGRGGTLAAMKAELVEHRGALQELKHFKVQVIATVAGGSAVGGVLAALVIFLIERALK